MYLVVGLGNPEPEYSMTRHNLGFDVINKVAERYDAKVEKQGFKALYGMANIEGEKAILVKPQTYMNLSGESIIELVNFYKIPLENIIVVYDDIDLPIGTVKIRKKGGPGTHNGMKSVVFNLDSTDFARVRIGAGMPEDKSSLIEYVIKKMKLEEYKTYVPGIEKGAEAIAEFIKNGIDKAMNKIN